MRSRVSAVSTRVKKGRTADRLFVDVSDAMRIVRDGGEFHDDTRTCGRLRLEADAHGERRVEAKGAKNLPTFSVRRKVEDVRIATFRDSQIDRISRKGQGIAVVRKVAIRTSSTFLRTEKGRR